MREAKSGIFGIVSVLCGLACGNGVLAAQESVRAETPENNIPAEAPENAYEQPTVHELEELVVQSHRAVIEDNRLVVVPTKAEKKLSSSPASLVDQMQFPGVRVEGDNIKALDGNNVAVFINGLRANNVDYQTFWPKNTVRVEYLIHPLDPQFEGEARVMNFIVAEPKTGGVTRLNANQTFPNSGMYTISSKLVADRMTYGFNFIGRYMRDHLSESGEETYSDLWYGDQSYEKIYRTYSSANDFRFNMVTAALNARYKTENLVLTHTVGLAWDQAPDNDGSSSQAWTPALFLAPSSHTQSSTRHLSPQVSGNYRIGLSQMVWLFANWQYNYTDGHNSSGYEQTGQAPLYNDTRERVHSFTVGLNPSLVKQNKWMLQLQTAFVTNLFNTHYTGTATTDQNMYRYDFTGGVKYMWNVTPMLALLLQPGVAVSSTRVAGVTSTEAKPTATASVQWTAGSKFSLMAGMSYYMMKTAPARVNPVMTRISDLEWQMGNPNLKNGDVWYGDLSGNYLCSNFFTLSWLVSYTHDANEIVEIYTPNPRSLGGVLRSYANMPASHRLLLRPDFNFRMIGGRLNVTLSSNYVYNHFSLLNSEVRTLSDFSGSVRVSGTVRNFSLALSYRTRSSYLTSGGLEKRKRPDSLDFTMSYGKGDFFAALSVNNILHNKYREELEYLSQTYSYEKTSLQIGKSVSVNLTYFFGFGKKTDRNIDIESISTGPTSVL